MCYRFKRMLILPTERLEEMDLFPHDPKTLEERVNYLCDQSRRKLLKEWLPMCADILLELKTTWKPFIPKKRGDTLYNIERFYECINALLAKQLRSLVMHSLAHFLNFIMQFKVFCLVNV